VDSGQQSVHISAWLARRTLASMLFKERFQPLIIYFSYSTKSLHAIFIHRKRQSMK